MAQGFSLKDQLFNPDTVGMLGQHFEEAGVFASAPFVDDVLAEMTPLELKARINLITEVLGRHLSPEFPKAAEEIRRALPPPLDPTLTDDDFGHFVYAPLGVYVETHGLEDHSDLSLALLEELTQRFSMEFSIRAFLNRWPDATLTKMQGWATHDSYHVRRLVSEGTRPKLPWGQGITIGADKTLPLLDMLYTDPTRFVTRSVANHLNDITKSDPDAVLARLDSWVADGQQGAKELGWMRTHALRGLIKAGHAGAMAHLGYRADVDVAVDRFEISPQSLAIDEKAAISVELSVPKAAPLIVDYVIDFTRPNGKVSRKVFKLKTFQAKPGASINLSKQHRFKGGATTFTLHPGQHQISLQVNGRVLATREFTLS